MDADDYPRLKMKLHQEDPRLTAYALGELPPEEAIAVERAIAADPSLRAAFAHTDEIRQALVDSLGGEKVRLQPRQRDAIRRAARETTRQGKVEHLSSHRQAQRTWLAPLAAAAVIISGIFLLTLFPKPNSAIGKKPVTANNDPIKGGGLEGRAERGNVIQLPLKASGNSLSQITDAIRGEKRFPKKEEVRISEMLNSFPLKSQGAVVLWNGCKLGAEILPSPWKPSGSLIIVEIEGAKDREIDLSVQYRAEEGVVIAHQLIGYPANHPETNSTPSPKMAANSRTILVIEVESRDLRLGSLHWSVGQKTAPHLTLVRDPEREHSDDARFASLVCAFGLWLRAEDGGRIDEDLLLALAREVASGSLVADRYDFLTLIDEATKLPDQ
ncbi:MAG: hypothetical protein RLZZ505_2776 [Verrucomicrobiota bacterium]|jgi:hypothetical protein